MAAARRCAICHGLGWVDFERRSKGRTCRCVWRAVFRVCLGKYRGIQAGQANCQTRASLERPAFRDKSGRYGFTWGRRNEEFCADFYLAAKRILDPIHWRVFVAHFLLGAEWKACCRALRIDRGNFFHAVYRVEVQLGRVCGELKPHALYPIDEYFGGVRERPAVRPSPPAVVFCGPRGPVRPVLRTTAAA